jgi:hypothetical protein
MAGAVWPVSEAVAHPVAACRAEIALRREHGADYRNTGYVLRRSGFACMSRTSVATPVCCIPVRTG